VSEGGRERENEREKEREREREFLQPSDFHPDFPNMRFRCIQWNTRFRCTQWNTASFTHFPPRLLLLWVLLRTVLETWKVGRKM
jgi:hypothetical protein